MRNSLLVLALVLLPSCKGLGAAIMGPDDSPEAQAEAIGTAAGDAAGLITGNPVIDAGVTLLVGGAAGMFLRWKKKTTKKTEPVPA